MSIRKHILPAAAGIVAITILSGCAWSADQATLDRQAEVNGPWWFGSSVRDSVYSPSVRDEVYSTETMTHP